jgi:hypothetical protein
LLLPALFVLMFRAAISVLSFSPYPQPFAVL